MSSPHISIRNKLCMFCQQRPEPGERIATVLDCSASKGYTHAFAMSLVGQVNMRYQDVYIDAETQQWLLCLQPGCNRCVSSPTLILYHSDCYQAFRVLWKRKDIESLTFGHTAIYRTGLSLNPWFPPSEKSRIYLNTPEAFQWWSLGLKEMSALSARAAELGDFVASLSALPLELLGLILTAGGSEIYRSALLRHVLVTQVASVISEQEKLSQNQLGNCASSASMPVLEFLGNRYITCKEDAATAGPLGVDHLGVRLSSDDCPWYLHRRDVELCYERPFIRPSITRRFELWDASERPKPGSYRFYSADENMSNPQQIRRINFSDYVGLTFFCVGRVLYGIHAHQTPHSSALDTYSSLSLSAQKFALLRYFPLNTNIEVINEIWVRETQPFPQQTRAIMIRTSQRTQIFGPDDGDRESHYVQLACGLISALLYHIPANGTPISVFGAVSQPSTLRLTPRSSAVPNIRDTLSMHSSQASLNDVAHVELYIHTLEDARCSGILIKHEDGREEALGQRRVGLPNVQTMMVSRPSQIHYKPFQTSNGYWGLNVMFSTKDDTKSLVDEGEGWLSRVMGGTVMWSFDWRNDQLQFFDVEQ